MKLAKLGTIFILVAMAALALCGSAFAADPVRGGEIKGIMDLEPVSLDPIYGNAVTSDKFVFNLFYESLFQIGEDGVFSNWLADSYKVSQDQKTITITLKKGILFHDGTPLNAEAAAWNINRTIDPKTNAPHSGDLGMVEKAEAVDEYTFKINLKTTSASILSALAFEAGAMISPTGFKKAGAAAFARNPVGTGPYKFQEWVGSDHVSGVRWEKYWRKGVDGKALPYTDKATIRFIKNTSVKIMELKAGNADIIDNVQVKDFKAVEGGDNVHLVNSPLSIAQYMAMNVTRPPFNNKDLRIAINYAVNFKALEKVISRGYGQVTPLFMGEGGLDYFSAKDVPAYKYNPDKAKEYFKKSGHKGPITLVVIQRDPDTQIAQLLQSQLKQVGIELKISVLERKAWVAKVLKLDYECGILRMTGPSPDPDILWSKFFGPDARFNWVGMKDKKVFDAVVNAATTLDREERRKWYKEATTEMLNQAYYVFLFLRPTKHAASKKLMNLKKEYMGSWMLSDCWIAK